MIILLYLLPTIFTLDSNDHRKVEAKPFQQLLDCFRSIFLSDLSRRGGFVVRTIRRGWQRRCRSSHFAVQVLRIGRTYSQVRIQGAYKLPHFDVTPEGCVPEKKEILLTPELVMLSAVCTCEVQRYRQFCWINPVIKVPGGVKGFV